MYNYAIMCDNYMHRHAPALGRNGMIAFGLKKLAAKYGMNIESGVAYGMVKDCLISLSEGAGYNA